MKTRHKLYRNSKFSFECKACGICCHDKEIQMNPYEIVRLADHLKIGTAEFLEKYITPGEPFLLFLENSACVFLTDKGCSVHPDRPLVCRLYPLGQHLTGTGVEHFRCLKLQPGCSGDLGENGTVTAFLNSQEVRPYMEAAEKYLRLFYR
ncbi:MAG: YkgJ family cysteine cluster protein, partial [Desulfobulbaceae bacterium]|nr:YkgJ family cysteine cluster protein [Desulfobulbaceae bacterium]